MGLRSLIALVSLLSVFSFAGCSKNAQKVAPETRGKRGESCLARNDCETGLACLGNICAKNEFNVDVTAKQCVRSECKEDSDCCGNRETEAPAKCKNRNQICDTATRNIPGCVATTCTSDATCGEGTCGPGYCSGTGQSSANTCMTAADCPKNTCVIASGSTYGSCSLTFATCGDGYPACTQTTSSCLNRVCNCTNPLYDPADPICTDKACEDICLLRCEDSLCVQDRSCKTSVDCTVGNLNTCDGGRCVECTSDKDCNTDDDETCEKGVCHKPCKQNEECGLFEECSKGGDCVYVGCQTDRECILAASRGSQINNGTGGTSPGGQLAVSSSDDPRLYKCLPSEAGSKINTCKIPCENDGSCGQFQVCDKGYCKFVGCETDDECRAYLGIANQMTSDAKPYVTTATCEKTPTTADSP